MKNGVVADSEYNMVEILKATVMIKVMPARAMIVLNNFVMARLPIPSKLGIILSKKLTGRNMAKMINKTCEKIMIPVNKKTKIEIPILKRNKKNTVPNREIVLIMVKLVLSWSSIFFNDYRFSIFTVVGGWASRQ